jgi:two-component system, OmpR family, response regulator RegX3
MNGRILLVDDDPGIVDVVSYHLERDGFSVETATDGNTALAFASTRGWDVVVLDLMLPGLPGTEVCRRLRAAGDTVPILMLTAKDAEIDRVLGLELGADDYLTKPFSTPELLSRIRALLRRREYDRAESARTPWRVGRLSMDFTRHRVSVEGRPVQLTPSELRVLSLLARKPGHAFSRRQIMEHLWESDHVGDEHACEVHISNLRRKIERDPARPERIVTVRSAGYKLVAA